MVAPRLIQAFYKNMLNKHIITTSRYIRRCYSANNELQFQTIRSLLFIPGNSEKMLSKILTIKNKDIPDAFVPDLEDSVPMDQKDNARQITSKFLKDNLTEKKDYLIIPRVNATLGDDVLYNDLASVALPNVDAITFGKAETIEQMDKICRMMTDIERTNRVGNRIKLIPTIETAKGIVNANQLCATNPGRIIGVAFGADDYAADLGFSRTVDDFEAQQKELFYARTVLAVAARASNILSFDTPCVNFKDPEFLRKECKAVKSIGFKGKFGIHPNQVSVLNEIFGVSDEELAYARRVVEAYEKSAKENERGSTQVDGRMIDYPVIRRCKAVIELAERVNKY